MWGNSDSLTWYHCVDEHGNSRNAQIIDSNGKPKEIYEQYKKAFYLDKEKGKEKVSLSGQEIGKGTVQEFRQDPERAIKTFSTLEQEIQRQEERNNEEIQGE